MKIPIDTCAYICVFVHGRYTSEQCKLHAQVRYSNAYIKHKSNELDRFEEVINQINKTGSQ